MPFVLTPTCVHMEMQKHSNQTEITVKHTQHSGEGLRVVTCFFWGSDVSGEGTVSLPACLPPQECLPEKQMPNVALRQ